jgi:hypothetical protein
MRLKIGDYVRVRSLCNGDLTLKQPFYARVKNKTTNDHWFDIISGGYYVADGLHGEGMDFCLVNPIGKEHRLEIIPEDDEDLCVQQAIHALLGELTKEGESE